MIRFLAFILLVTLQFTSVSQDTNRLSIHQFENDYYKNHDINLKQPLDFITRDLTIKKSAPLVKRVFGYHPYWSGEKYHNYQWTLLTDLCYFSYEVDPVTGNPTTIHDWETSPAIDSALANGVKVHLCVTLFSGHADFFGSELAQQTLIDNIITLIQERNANGVNMDVEALPSSQSENFTAFMIELCNQVHFALPGAEVSIAAPAVNWSDKFDIPVLNDYLDFFMVMAYDYYWSGATEAGPVSPLYSMVNYYNYNFSKTVSYYQSQGVPAEKLLFGVPYYAYQWPTEGATAPSATTGSATAYTYSYVKNNTSGNYSTSNKHIEENSFGRYYSFDDGGWYQCWIDDVFSMGKKFDVVNRRGLGGIGIWALGYDDGYPDFWVLINEKFTEGGEIVQADTIFDSGGPAWDYYDREDYLYTITTVPGGSIHLAFSYLNIEEGYDTLWIYDGPDASAPLISFYNNDSLPASIASTGNTLTLRFKSDNATVEAGWRAVYDTMPVSGISENQLIHDFTVYPNPFTSNVFVSFSTEREHSVVLEVIDMKGLLIRTITENRFPPGDYKLVWNGRDDAGMAVKPGNYVICLYLDGKLAGCEKVMRSGK